MIRSKWGKDENTYGSYTYISKTGTPSDYHAFTFSINQKVYFGGEHTN